MNLQPLFETQKILDDRIVEQHGLEGQDLLPEKILALQVELGELANEWRGFKFWSEDREPRTCVIQKDGETANEYYQNPLLEEYVDCLHFILSIGNAMEEAEDVITNARYGLRNFRRFRREEITQRFAGLFYDIARLNLYQEGAEYYEVAMNFIDLGGALGLPLRRIEDAYYAKNKINHDRQATGY